MAGDWIKMRSSLWDHPKVVRIVSAICPQGVRDLSLKCRVIGALFRTWSLADAHTLDGVLDGYDADALNAAVGIEGWAESLQHVGWLTVESQRLIVPRFTEHGGQTAKRRAEDAARKGRVRKLSATNQTNVRSRADKLRNREEKRREEKNKKSSGPTSIPELLRTPEFETAWKAWEQHRQEKKSPLTPSTVVAQLKMLAKLGSERAVATIEHTICKGWTGLQPPDSADRPAPPKPPPVNAPLPPKRTKPVDFKHDPYATSPPAPPAVTTPNEPPVSVEGQRGGGGGRAGDEGVAGTASGAI